MNECSQIKMPPIQTKCDRCQVNKAAICRVADNELSRELNRISHIRTFAAGRTVAVENEDAEFVGNVVSGALRLLKTMPDGRQQIVGLLVPSDMFGRVFSTTSRFTIEAATAVTLCCFERKAFEAVLDRHRELEREILKSSLEELDAARDWMLLLGRQNVLERVASFLLILNRPLRQQGCATGPRIAESRISVPISRRDMATYLGTTVESISRSIQYLARKGIIRIINAQLFELLCKERLVEISGHAESRWWDMPEPMAGDNRKKQALLRDEAAC